MGKIGNRMETAQLTVEAHETFIELGLALPGNLHLPPLVVSVPRRVELDARALFRLAAAELIGQAVDAMIVEAEGGPR